MTKKSVTIIKNTPGLHRVAVGATGRSPAHPHGALTRIFRGCCHRGRASTRPYIAYCKSIKYGADYINKNAPRVTPRSCRGDREVARNTRMAHSRAYSGVAVNAGELPLAPTLHIVNQRNTQGLHQQKIHYGLHRVAVGATGRSPATSAWRGHAHIPGVAVTAGELPLAPTLHVVNQ